MEAHRQLGTSLCPPSSPWLAQCPPMSNIGVAIVLRGELGETDCEEIGEGILNQPVNTLSSCAYTVFGAWLIWQALRRRSDDTSVEVFFGLALASVGIGSVAFHGPAPPGARLLHDLTIVAPLAVIAARSVGELYGWDSRRVIGAASGTIIIVGVVTGLVPDLGIIAAGLVGAGAVITGVLVHRAGRHRFSRRANRLLVVVVVLVALAGVVNVLGRTGGPICDPDSYFQGHAVWHVLTAAAFAFYGLTALSPSFDPTAATGARN